MYPYQPYVRRRSFMFELTELAASPTNFPSRVTAVVVAVSKFHPDEHASNFCNIAPLHMKD
jgi:hypothetical protein